jgi:GrpB-like predicted nucleotidyltransferase (UPF0157 family)
MDEPAAAQEYARIKVEMARRFPHDGEAYMAGKDGFIKETLANSLEWYAGLDRHNESLE